MIQKIKKIKKHKKQKRKILKKNYNNFKLHMKRLKEVSLILRKKIII